MTDMEGTRTVPVVSGWRLAVDRAPQFLSLLLLFLLPFLFQLKSSDPVFVKQVLVQILVPFLLVFFLLKPAAEGRAGFVFLPALVPGAALLLWCLAGTFLSPTPGAAWAAWRDWFWVPLWFFLLTQTCHELWRAENLLLTWMAAALGTALWGITQAFGWLQGDWLLLVNLQYDRRALAGFGNPDHLAGYLLLVWPMALALLVRAKSRFARIYWGLTLGLVLWCLLLTRCMSAGLGFAVGSAVLAVLMLMDRTSSRKGWAVMGLVLAILMTLSFAGPLLKQTGLVDRPGNVSAHHRREVTTGTWRMIGEHSVRGTGFGTYAAAFPPYRPIPMLMRQTQGPTRIRHAYNFVLEWWAESGSVGLLLLALFWAAVLWPWWKLYRGRAIPPSLGAGAFAAFAGCAVNNLFNMDHALPATIVPLLFLAALPVPLSQRFLSLPGYPVRRWESASSVGRALWAAAAVLALAGALWTARDGMKRQWATLELKKAWADSAPGQWDQALMFYESALGLDPGRIETTYLMSAVLLERGKEGDAQRALDLTDRVIAVEPHYLHVRLNRSRALRVLGRGDEAASEFAKAVRLDPQIIHRSEDFIQARDLLSRRKWEESRAIYFRLSKEHPRCPPVWMDLGSVQERMGRFPEALESYRQALALYPDYLDALRAMGRTAVRVGRRDDAEAVIARLRVLFPETPWVEEYIRGISGGSP